MAAPPNPENNLPFSFDEAMDRLLKADPRKLPPAVRPATAKGKAKKRPARKKAKG
jgi:hypothetical protein